MGVARQIELAPGIEGLELASDDIVVIILPGKGCDIYSFLDRITGVDVLFKSPWGLRVSGPGSLAPDSLAHWLEYYPGGWQVLLPNGGDACTMYGVEWGYHGEACLVPWHADELGESYVRCSTRLFRSPLRLQRDITVHGPVLRIEETVTNESPDPIDIMWTHHPAFGAPFLGQDCSIFAGARAFQSDDINGADYLAPGSRHAWPTVRSKNGELIDLSMVPALDHPTRQLGYLTDFDDGFFAISNGELGFGVGFRWPIDVFPHAWFWQEIRATAEYPWYRCAHVMAIEPSTTIPAQGLSTARQKGGAAFRLQGKQSHQITIEAVIYRGCQQVIGIEPGGIVRFAS